jgi:PEP-CTERM motif
LKYKRSHRSRRGRRTGIGRLVFRSLLVVAVVSGGIFLWQWHQSRSSVVAVIDSSSSQRLLALGGFSPDAVRMQGRRIVYPYSVIPGGVESPAELREAADHDPVVAQHYASFDYRTAHVVEVKDPKLVYLSYRRGNHVYWSRKQAHLHKGEKLITDGRITARERCGNQVSVLPQANTSPNEPSMAEMDHPVAVASGMQRAFPSSFDSSLLNIDPGLPFGPVAGGPLAGGPFPGGFMPMPIGAGGITGSSNPPTCTGTGCNPPPPPPPPPPTPVPEPATLLLFGSGAAVVIARLWQKKN